MSKFDRVEKGTKIVITPSGVRVLSKWFEAGQIAYFEGFKSSSDSIIRVRIPGKKEIKHYSDEFWRVWTGVSSVKVAKRQR